MQGRLLLGAGAVLALAWWFANGRVDAWSRAPDQAVPASHATRTSTTGASVDAPRRAIVGAAAAHLGERAAPARDILVVDANRQPIVGAEISSNAVYRSDGSRGDTGTCAMTDRNGRARLAASDDRGVTVCAPGFRLTYADTPATDVEWVIVLERALRLEITVVGASDFTGLHARVDLPRTCPPGPFYQSKYQQTPGRAVADTTARWTHDHVPDGTGASVQQSFWSVCLPDTGTAVLV